MRQVDFSGEKILPTIAQTALPLLAAQLLTLLYSIVDRIYLGRIPQEGTAALGAIGLCFPIIMLINAFTNLYGSGGSPLCAIERGKGNRVQAERIMNTSAALLLLTGVVIMVTGELFAEPLLRLFGASDASLPYALPYLRIYLLGTVFVMLSTGLTPYINAQGFPAVGMTTIAVGALCNLILDPLLIYAAGLGVRGAAIATVFSQALSMVLVLGFLYGNRAELRLGRKLSDFTFEKTLTMNIISLGSAGFIMQCTNSLVSIACNSVLSRFGGDLYVSVMTTVSSVRQILDTPVSAITDGSSPIISFLYGARHPRRILRVIRVMTIISVGYTAVVWLCILLFPETFISVFSSDPALLSAAVPALRLYFFAFLFQALQYSGQTVFKSLGKKKQAIFFSLFRKVVMVVPLTYLLPYVGGLGASGVFLAEPISNFIGGCACFIAMLVMVLPELRRMEKG
ncbi:MAG: MATE family efflux transporter [Eubacteriales bacterium]|nr:MATE family efflux transporter [Eubacteriales bacterium]